MTSTIDQVYSTFLEKVALGRKMPVSEVDARAQGRVYSGLQALDLKLVDAIGGLPDAFKAAKELAGFDVDKLYPVLHYEGDEFALHECLGSPQQMMRCLRRGGARVALPPLAVGLAWGQASTSRAEAIAKTLERWVDAGALAVWPGYLSAEIDRPMSSTSR
jgi:ClpP class serine protease